MAEHNSVQYAKEADPYFGNRNPRAEGIIQVTMVPITWEIPAGAAAADTVNLVSLHPGQYIVPSLCWVECENPGTTLTLDIGDTDDTTAADPDRYVDGLNVSAGGGFAWTAADGVHTLTPYVIQKECVLQATLATAASLTTGQDFTFWVAIANGN